ncbi:MAG: type 4a pilus biogenesis protein PilO [Xanthomonadales bacterium]|nr:type 4a pilus biogenesis protein PilO [Xanthomonadales bacterium]NIN58720.1 type 4a pilus biogenesis protein PilO [Xanthomonadales bacterium]NIN73986.1 type 4a pilus biogenesis protein PilO [Xanthomonadales bacterium]NIO12901.1 type 4a pilus biogenesis protein PilO [Xanthomonadales bacterium]NIP11113.1 type 4a pilus biogenesis protein PilO [Xanthomonadales bacterium]
MILNDFRDTDFSDLGSAPATVRYTLLALLLVALGAIGYYMVIKDKWAELDRVKLQELSLRTDFENKQQKAANLEAYEEQLAEMQDMLQTMFRQLPSKTEMDKLLVDISQTALAAGIDVQLFEPLAEEPRDFYAERPISIRMLGEYHQFGEFVGAVAALPRVVILTMHDISLRRAERTNRGSVAEGMLILEGQVKTYRYIDEEEAAQIAAEAAP